MTKSKPKSSKKATTEDHAHGAESSWIERNVNTIIIALIVACVLTSLAQLDFVYGLGYDEHHPPHFPQETWFGFQAIFGFVAFVVIVFLGRGLRMIVSRPEDYYDA